jgi:hypothetical protein
MIDKFTKQLTDKLYIQFQKEENQKKLNECIKILIANIMYQLIPYISIGFGLYIILIILNIYIIFQIKNILPNNI